MKRHALLLLLWLWPAGLFAQKLTKPDPNDFETQASYLNALVDWKLDVHDSSAPIPCATLIAMSDVRPEAIRYDTSAEYLEDLTDWKLRRHDRAICLKTMRDHAIKKETAKKN
ncbi:MAG: hypothetical protein V4734_08745 [Terriglobus sp.]